MKVNGSTPLWIAARILLYQRGDELFQLWEKVMDTFDPEDIHDMRVASRRLREGVAIFAPCYAPEIIKHLDRRVKKITRLLGGMRNTDEAIIFFSHLAEELKDVLGGELNHLVVTLESERQRERRRMEKGLRRMSIGEVREQFRRSINSLSLFTPGENCPDLFAPLEDFAAASLGSRRLEAIKLLPEACNRMAFTAQHRLRIALKHFRYRMEILSFILGDGYRHDHAVIKAYQDVLGKMHDLDVFSGMVRETALPPAAEKMVMDAIIEKRESLFSDFSVMVKGEPLEKLGMPVGSAR